MVTPIPKQTGPRELETRTEKTNHSSKAKTSRTEHHEFIKKNINLPGMFNEHEDLHHPHNQSPPRSRSGSTDTASRDSGPGSKPNA